MKHLRKGWLLPAALIALAGCSDEGGPLGTGAPATGNGNVLAELECQADLNGKALACSPAENAGPAGVSAAILAGQALNVLLESSNISYNAEVFSADVTVRNFLTQDLGDDVDGIQVFFLDAPSVTAGSGVVTVANPTGQGDFTGTGQDFFGYSGPLAPGLQSEVVTWEWNVPATVDAFSFKVAVSGPVADEANLAPGVQLSAKTVAGKRNHHCALDLEGKAYCWGTGTSGQLGNGGTTSSYVPVAVEGGHTFTYIEAGSTSTCAIATTGKTYCWGNNQYGKVGVGDTITQIYPTPTEVDTDQVFTTLSVGFNHVCAISTDNEAYCWGRGNYGKLGNGKAGASYGEGSPVPVVTDLKFSSIGVSDEHTCAVAVDGKGYCWGHGESGRGGNGTTGRTDKPTEIIGGHLYTKIDAGTTYSCGLTTDGEIYCWGVNASEMQGHGLEEEGKPLAQNDAEHPVAGGHTWVSMSASHAHTCGINADSELYCWGNSDLGRLGIGNVDGTFGTPQRVHSDRLFSTVVVGQTSTCAIPADGDEVYCWGSKTNGRLGAGTDEDQYLPVLISPIGES